MSQIYGVDKVGKQEHLPHSLILALTNETSPTLLIAGTVKRLHQEIGTGDDHQRGPVWRVPGRTAPTPAVRSQKRFRTGPSSPSPRPTTRETLLRAARAARHQLYNHSDITEK